VMKKLFLFFGVFGLVFLCGCSLWGGDVSAGDASASVTASTGGTSISFETSAGKTVISVEVADTFEERTKGLMYRKSLESNKGMFFVFETDQPLNFWMKNTLIPLDMIFLDGNYSVVKIQKNAQPCKKDPCQIYSSGRAAKYVIEVNGGMSDKMGLKVGDKAQLTI
jgi:uncharacterized membrane protein (UPF0127 family)